MYLTFGATSSYYAVFIHVFVCNHVFTMLNKLHWNSAPALWTAIVHHGGVCRCEINHPIFICFPLTGITQSKEKHIALSYVIGKLTFVDTPKIYERGSTIEGKVRPNTVILFLRLSWIVDAICLWHSCLLNYQWSVTVTHITTYNSPPPFSLRLTLFTSTTHLSQTC